MTYTTLAFALFAAVTVLLYYLRPLRKVQWVVLLAASAFFYLYNSYRYCIWILLTAGTIYLAARRIEAIRAESKAAIAARKSELTRDERKALKQAADRRARRLLALVLAVNFGVLVFLKYFSFLAGGLSALLPGISQDPSAALLPALHLILPLGISFYTFQSTGYLIDVYRGTVKSERNFGRFLLFVSFFPAIVQGPISSYGQLGEELSAEHAPDWYHFKLGGELILWGIFKKLIIADRAVILINCVTDDYTKYSGPVILLTALFYALQLYADFSGGIDISRGLCRVLGIRLTENFRQPYFSKSINEYWRRWHITLGAWMKNYVFYPLAMSNAFLTASRRMKESRFGRTRAGAHIAKVLPTAIASFVVFLLVGIWHGANSKYVAFGIWNGGIIMISVLLAPLYGSALRAFHIRAESFGWRLFQMLRTFVLVLVGYYFDIAPSSGGAIDMMKRSVTEHSWWLAFDQLQAIETFHMGDYLILIAAAVVLLAVSIRLERTGLETPGDLLARHSARFQWMVLLVTILAVLIFGVYGPGYNPADFVYMQF